MKPVPVVEHQVKVPFTDPTACVQLVRGISGFLSELPPGRRIVLVCVGTDRCTGDSLGPLVGTTLLKYRSPHFDLFGTLERPVHAINLYETLSVIQETVRNPYVIGIDACLGLASSVGSIEVGEGPVRPGAGVNKELPPVGDMHVTGVVNVGGFLQHAVLQNTRLHLVMGMADLIARSLYRSVTMWQRSQAAEGPAIGGPGGAPRVVALPAARRKSLEAGRIQSQPI
ncbi:spore protease YyaC [Paenibacillus aurantius]|uniref:Spore protease YyaC n=1 Tax=Paenibacillus aurantius TaxID=2918900 RepID=A0AA96L8I6_9BACL|nr:spore protease YyaC [Paenibacillus aurantius]WNQ09039.1 spore protease YyaC [Paenibacillus aurantius]